MGPSRGRGQGWPKHSVPPKPREQKEGIAVGRGESRDSQITATTEKDNSSPERKKREGRTGEKVRD